MHNNNDPIILLIREKTGTISIKLRAIRNDYLRHASGKVNRLETEEFMSILMKYSDVIFDYNQLIVQVLTDLTGKKSAADSFLLNDNFNNQPQ